MTFSKTVALAMGCATLAVGTIALAAPAGEVISARQANFKEMGKAMKASFGELKQAAPSGDAFKANANALASSAVKVAAGFPRGTGPESGAKTQALPAIWEKPDEFRADADKLVKAALMQVGGACKGCHDSFRAKDN